MQKTARKNTKYSTNETILKIGYLPKAIFQRLKPIHNLVPRVSLLCLHCLFSTTMEAEKRDPRNEVGPCKGLCKMVSLGQKLKMPKIWENHSTKLLELFCAKNRSKKHQYSRKEAILKIAYLPKAKAHAKAIAHPKNKHQMFNK